MACHTSYPGNRSLRLPPRRRQERVRVTDAATRHHVQRRNRRTRRTKPVFSAGSASSALIVVRRDDDKGPREVERATAICRRGGRQDRFFHHTARDGAVRVLRELSSNARVVSFLGN